MTTPTSRGPANRPSASDEIIAKIRAQISSGELARGDQLPNEKELARQFGVSQPTMREAIRALDAMGLLEVYHGRGVFVSRDLNEFVSNSLQTYIEFEGIGLLDALDVRGALGRESAKQAALNATQQDKDALVRAAKACDDPSALLTVEDRARSVVNFQSAVSAAARNPLLFAVEVFLIRMLLQLQVDAKQEQGADYWVGQLRDFRTDRWEITDHVLQGDPGGAEAAMVVYLSDQRTLFSSDPDMARVRLRPLSTGLVTIFP